MPLMIENEIYLTRDEAAEYLHVQPETMAVWAATGRYQISYIKVGRKVHYSKNTLKNFIVERTIYLRGQ